jgi:hypothetical protein
VKRVAVLALLGALAAGCGGAASYGRATVWITRDRGARVLHVAQVPAGLTAMQGLSRVAKVKSRYGGRYVQAVDGLKEHGRRAWFYYVNGYLADRSAAEYVLHKGDLEWWDFRSWDDPAQYPVVVGAFPEPFLHGYGGKRRSAAILYQGRRLRRGALALARLLHARFVGPIQARQPSNDNMLLLVPRGRRSVKFRQVGQATPPRPGGPVFFSFSGDPLELARHPRMFRFRYSVR